MKPIADLEYFDRKTPDKNGRIRSSPAFIVVGPDGSRSVPLNNNQVRKYLNDNGWRKADQ